MVYIIIALTKDKNRNESRHHETYARPGSISNTKRNIISVTCVKYRKILHNHSTQAIVCNGRVKPSEAFNMVVANSSSPIDKASKKYGNIITSRKKERASPTLSNLIKIHKSLHYNAYSTIKK